MNNAELEEACEALIEYAKEAISNKKALNKLVEQFAPLVESSRDRAHPSYREGVGWVNPDCRRPVGPRRGRAPGGAGPPGGPRRSARRAPERPPPRVEGER